MPVLKKLVKEGAGTWAAQTITPSITLPAHTSMLTGVPAEIHHITWNDWRPTKGIVGVSTIFAAAKQAGRSTAMFAGKEKFRHLLQPNTVDEFYYDRSNAVVVLKSDNGDKVVKKEGCIFAKMVATNAANYIVKNKPDLCFVHFTDPDTVGHEFGWGSPEQIKAFADVDAALGIIRRAIQQAGIARHSIIIITADHGGHGKGHVLGTPEDKTIPWIAWGQGVKKHFTITAPVNTCDTAATALWLLDVPPMIAMTGTPVTSAFK
jgi:predicted AlkP superfamily pyrophosphatase or phosphodiesterase